VVRGHTQRRAFIPLLGGATVVFRSQRAQEEPMFGSTLRASICSTPIDKCSRDKRGERDLAGESGEQAVAFGGEILVRNAAFGVARKVWFQPIEEEHFVCAFVFGHDGTARLQFE